MNESIFRAINTWPDFLSPFMWFFSAGVGLLPVRLALLAIVIGLITRKGSQRTAAIQALIAFPLADGSTNILKHLAPMPRPCSVLNDVLIHGMGCSNSMGTASAHSANMAAIAFVFVYHLRWWGSPWVVVALVTGFSRVYHGAHYPSQVLLGWICGIVVAFVVTQVGERIRKRRANVTEGEGHAQVDA